MFKKKKEKKKKLKTKGNENKASDAESSELKLKKDVDNVKPKEDTLHSPSESYSPRLQDSLSVGPKPQTVECPFCNRNIETKVTSYICVQTHFLAVALICICICICWIPYVMKAFKTKVHHCPECNAYLGSYRECC